MESAEFCNIAITPENPVREEAQKITHLLTHGGFERVHLRHPGLSAEQLSSIVADIPASMHHRISVHACDIIPGLPEIGLHLPSKGVKPLHHNNGLISKSCHSLTEVDELSDEYDYLFLSPIFDSLSKTGYSSRFKLDSKLKATISQHRNIIALGGITPQNIYAVKRAGFAGTAMLGAIPWTKNMTEFNQYNVSDRMVQFITDGTPEQCIHQAEEAIKGGVRWVQLRLKDTAPATVKSTALTILPICRKAGAIFIINDHPQVALEIGADGVHLGKNDMPPAEARRLLGPDYIIGATANSLEDVKNIANEPIDYIGLGPLHFTGTKKNLAAVLGFDGISSILNRMQADDINIPVVVIGGITADDIPAVVKSGANGVAVSGAIAHAEKIAQAARELIEII